MEEFTTKYNENPFDISGIYYIQVNGAYYIGQTVSISRRLEEHKHAASKGLTPFYKAMRDDGYTWGIVETCAADELDKKEIYWIDKVNTFKRG